MHTNYKDDVVRLSKAAESLADRLDPVVDGECRSAHSTLVTAKEVNTFLPLQRTTLAGLAIE